MARICHVAFSYYSTDPRTSQQSKALVRRGDEVDVVCLKDIGTGMEQHAGGVRFFPISIKKYRGDSNLAYLVKYFSFFVRTFLRLTILHLKRHYDIIQVHTLPDFLVFTAFLPKLLGAKVILDVHELMPELYASKFDLAENHPLIKFIAWIERRSISFADRAIAVHLPHRDVLVQHGNPPEKFSISLNLPDPELFSCRQAMTQAPNGKFRLIYHGTIARRHGVEIALRALRLAKDSMPPFEFEVMGDGDDLERLVRLAKDLSLSGCVTFTGRVPLREIPGRISGADLGVVPILYDSFTRYMLPVKVMEYVRVGIPVVASRTETMKAYFDESMIRYFEAGNEHELARHLIDLFNHPEQRERLALNANRFNEQFSWENQKIDYFNLIDSLA